MKMVSSILHTAACLDMKDTSQAELVCSNNDLNYEDFRFVDYLGGYINFEDSPEGYVFCNGKEIYCFDNHKKILEKETIRPNEWINGYYLGAEEILLSTHVLEKKAHPTKFDIAYGLDSIASNNIVCIDRVSGLKQLIKLDIREAYSFALTSDKLVFIERDKENYYVTRIPVTRD
jgi:hypothetical protein